MIRADTATVLTRYADLLRSGHPPADAFTAATAAGTTQGAQGAAVLRGRGTLPEALTAAGLDPAVAAAADTLLAAAPARPDVLTAFADLVAVTIDTRAAATRTNHAWAVAVAACLGAGVIAGTGTLLTILAGPTCALGAVAAWWWLRRTLRALHTAEVAAATTTLTRTLTGHGLRPDTAARTATAAAEALTGGSTTAEDATEQPDTRRSAARHARTLPADTATATIVAAVWCAAGCVVLARIAT